MSTVNKVALSVQDDTPITIAVQDPQLDQAGGFHTYLVTGTDKQGPFEIRRRFNDFFVTRQALRKKWPGCYVPPIPSKKLTGTKEDKFVDERRRFLNYFCEKMTGIKYLYYSQVFQLFLRNKGGELQKTLDAQPAPSTLQTITVYKQLFGSYLNKQNQADLKAKTSSFYAYLKKSEKELKILKEDMNDVAQAKRAFNSTLNVVTGIMMPEYEKSVLLEYVNQQNECLIFSNSPQVIDKSRQLKQFTSNNSLDFLSDLLNFEAREVQAMQEAIQGRDQIENNMRKLQQKRKDDQQQMAKLMSGKTTFKSIFTKGNKTQQSKMLERVIAEDEKQIEYLGVLVEYINVILSLIEIPKFKKYKQRQYYEFIQKAARMQLKHLHIYGAMLKSALIANENIKLVQ